MGVVNLVVLACVLRTTTEERKLFFFSGKSAPKENSGYAYV